MFVGMHHGGEIEELHGLATVKWCVRAWIGEVSSERQILDMQTAGSLLENGIKSDPPAFHDTVHI